MQARPNASPTDRASGTSFGLVSETYPPQEDIRAREFLAVIKCLLQTIEQLPAYFFRTDRADFLIRAQIVTDHFNWETAFILHGRNLVYGQKPDVYQIQSKGSQRGLLVTLTITDWIDVFTRLKQKHLLINSLAYCQREKGLEIYAYCIMTNHLHMLCRVHVGYLLSDIIRDFKKFTSRRIVKNIQEYPESRREWMLNAFKQACNSLKRNQQYKVWQDGYHAEIAYSNRFIKQKLDYIHNNPVVERIVEYPEDYLFSSARNLCRPGQ